MRECRNCAKFDAASHTCRAAPPVRLPRAFSDKATAGNRVRDEQLIWGWPDVEPYDWCYKWKRERFLTAVIIGVIGSLITFGVLANLVSRFRIFE
jgi:hypothetical protein